MSDLVKRLEEAAEMVRTAKIADPLLFDMRDLFLEIAATLKTKYAEIERLTAELAAAKAKHYEECAALCDAIEDGFDSSKIKTMLTERHIYLSGAADGAMNCVLAIRAALTDTKE